MLKIVTFFLTWKRQLCWLYCSCLSIVAYIYLASNLYCDNMCYRGHCTTFHHPIPLWIQLKYSNLLVEITIKASNKYESTMGGKKTSRPEPECALCVFLLLFGHALYVETAIWIMTLTWLLLASNILTTLSSVDASRSKKTRNCVATV